MITFLTYAVIILVISTAVYLIRISDLSRDIRGEREEIVTDSENRQSAIMFIVFMVSLFAGYAWLIMEYGSALLPKAASEHGTAIDSLMNINLWIVNIVFVIINVLLFGFAFKYERSKVETADFYPHNNKLELVWTIIPSIFLAGIIIYGLSVWSAYNKIIVDSTLWIAGIVLLATGVAVFTVLKNLAVEIKMTVGGSLMLFGMFFISYYFIATKSYDVAADTEEPILIELYAKQFDWTARYAGADNELGAAHVRYIEGANTLGLNEEDKKGMDDKLVRTEFHIPKGYPVKFLIRSQDVIHSAYMPHFRAQVNAVPGMPTSFSFTPIYTTKEMRADSKVGKKYENINELRSKKGEEPVEFDYVLLCNKICGAAHYNMRMTIVVDELEDYNAWIAKQKTFLESTTASADTEEGSDAEQEAADENNQTTEVKEQTTEIKK